MTTRRHTTVDSPIGPLTLAADDGVLCRIEMEGQRHAADPGQLGDRAAGLACLDLAAEQLDEYFSGGRRRFELPLAPTGTPWQLRVWSALADIPYGATESYGSLASRVGRPGAARAVGAANGRNPLPLVLPCHRVVGSDGSMTGFGGGIERKLALLALEAGSAPRRSVHHDDAHGVGERLRLGR